MTLAAELSRVMELADRITEVMNLPGKDGKGLELTGQGYVLLHNIRTELLALAAPVMDVRCDAIPKHDWQQMGEPEPVPENYGYHDTLVAGWEQCSACGLKRHYMRDRAPTSGGYQPITDGRPMIPPEAE